MRSPREFLTALEQVGIKLGLDQIRGLLEALDHPERAYRAVAVAGTNGKGSVTAMIERGLRAAGSRTGRYTSPHLVRLEERVAVDGLDVTPDELDRALEHVQRASAALPGPPTFFEATTAAALHHFRACAIDIAVLEVGLGGRLDATNAVDAQASVITAIDFDHQQYLGTTLEAIAREKAGIVKPGAVCVLASNPSVVADVVAGRCREIGADFIDAELGTSCAVELHDGHARVALRTPVRDYGPVTLRLRGRHQVSNAVAAVRALEELDRRRIAHVPAAAIVTALDSVEWPARLELVAIDGYDVLIDGAHNVAGATALAAFIRETRSTRVPIVLGAMRDKDVAAVVAELAPVAARLVCTAIASPRAMNPSDLAALARAIAPGMAIDVCDSPRAAIAMAGAGGAPVVVAGSLYLAGEVRSLIS